jgi:hypothetical protein
MIEDHSSIGPILTFEPPGKAVAMDRARQLAHLAEAERHVFEGDRRIGRQEEIVSELHRQGHDTRRALSLLALFRQVQTTYLSHRDYIQKELEE